MLEEVQQRGHRALGTRLERIKEASEQVLHPCSDEFHGLQFVLLVLCHQGWPDSEEWDEGGRPGEVLTALLARGAGAETVVGAGVNLVSPLQHQDILGLLQTEERKLKHQVCN